MPCAGGGRWRAARRWRMIDLLSLSDVRGISSQPAISPRSFEGPPCRPPSLSGSSPGLVWDQSAQWQAAVPAGNPLGPRCPQEGRADRTSDGVREGRRCVVIGRPPLPRGARAVCWRLQALPPFLPCRAAWHADKLMQQRWHACVLGAASQTGVSRKGGFTRGGGTSELINI